MSSRENMQMRWQYLIRVVKFLFSCFTFFKKEKSFRAFFFFSEAFCLDNSELRKNISPQFKQMATFWFWWFLGSCVHFYYCQTGSMNLSILTLLGIYPYLFSELQREFAVVRRYIMFGSWKQNNVRDKSILIWLEMYTSKTPKSIYTNIKWFRVVYMNMVLSDFAFCFLGKMLW